MQRTISVTQIFFKTLSLLCSSLFFYMYIYIYISRCVYLSGMYVIIGMSLELQCIYNFVFCFLKFYLMLYPKHIHIIKTASKQDFNDCIFHSMNVP